MTTKAIHKLFYRDCINAPPGLRLSVSSRFVDTLHRYVDGRKLIKFHLKTLYRFFLIAATRLGSQSSMFERILMISRNETMSISM